MAALVAGTLLAVGALAYVLHPLFFGKTTSGAARPSRIADPKNAALSALREIEFDRATGKLSDADYAQLKQRYTETALTAMRGEDDAARTDAPATDDEIEAALSAYRARQPTCVSCGPRPEPDAVYCSSCGKRLRTSCAHCGAPVGADESRFCPSCGHRLAA